MKNLICFLILLAFGTFIFFTGWTQIKVKPENCGAVISKTGGINQKPVVNGVFTWNKEFLLPGNAQLLIFSNEPLSVTKTISGSSYSSEYDSPYSFTFDITLAFTPESIIDLLNENKITNNEDFRKYLDQSASQIAQSAAEYYLRRYTDSSSFKTDYVKREDLFRSLETYKSFPEIDVTVFALTSYTLPKKTEQTVQSLVQQTTQTIPETENETLDY